MIYTKDNVEGVRFHDTIHIYTVMNVRVVNNIPMCDLIPESKNVSILNGYRINYLLMSLNNGGWKVQNSLYEIY